MRILCLCLASIIATGCSEALPPTIDGPMSSVMVYGAVSRPDGLPAPGVSVIVEARVQASCANDRVDRDSVVTDAAGHYRAALLNWGTLYTVCVALRVAPGAMSGFATDSVQRAPVLMRAAGSDSVRVDIQLRPIP